MTLFDAFEALVRGSKDARSVLRTQGLVSSGIVANTLLGTDGSGIDDDKITAIGAQAEPAPPGKPSDDGGASGLEIALIVSGVVLGLVMLAVILWQVVRMRGDALSCTYVW